jgi:DNA-binding MarR family transcriptional regulator
LTQSEIGRALGILRANMAPLTAALVRQGLIVRKRVDGRSQALRLSAAGEAICREAWAITLAHEEKMFTTMSRTARRHCIEDLHAVWESHSDPESDDQTAA